MKSFFLIIIVFLTSALSAQEAIESYHSPADTIRDINSSSPTNRNALPLSFHTQLSSEYIVMPGMMSLAGVSASPSMIYRPKGRWSFSAGVTASYFTPFVINQTDEYQVYGGMPAFSGFVSSSYMVNENLTLHGTGVKGMMISGYNNEFLTDFHDLSVGATYDFGSFSIGASFHKSNRSFPGIFPGQGSLLFY